MKKCEQYYFLLDVMVYGKYSIWWVNNSICCTLLAPVNKLFSLTWLLWALRSFWRFTLHYITLH